MRGPLGGTGSGVGVVSKQGQVGAATALLSSSREPPETPEQERHCSRAALRQMRQVWDGDQREG